MKKTRKLTVLLLSAVMIISCATPALAATADNVYQYGAGGGYLAIGDSISRGYGGDGYYKGQSGTYSYRTVEGSFPSIVAAAVGCTAPASYSQNGNYWGECFEGQTLYSTMDLYGIEDGVTDSEYAFGNYRNMLNYYGYEGSSVGAGGETYKGSSVAGNIIEITKSADLITLELGMCDVFYRPLRVVTNKYNIDMYNPNLEGIDACQIAEMVATCTEEAYWGYNYWLNNYTKLLERIKELNPDATIVLVGSYNMLSDITLSNSLVTPLGSVFSAISASMNAQYEKWAKEYNVLYADISNTESKATENGWALLSDEFLANAGIATHPSQEGNSYIARQVLSVLPEKIVTPSTPSTDIVVDLGAIKGINAVTVGGKSIKNYSMNGSILTVPYSSKLAKSMTVIVVGTDKKITTRTYTLAYSKDSGYKATKIYGTNDAVGLVTKPIKTVTTVVTKAVSAIKSLFKR